jgi:hypothetical protein
LADADQFTRSQLVAPRLTLGTERQAVPADPFAWEVTEQEEALARVWSAIYALRAELLAIERLVSLDADRQQVIAHIVTAAWRWALASTAATDYATAFSSTSGTSSDDERERTAAELVALAGWVPPLWPAQQERLRAAVAGEATRANFVAAMQDEVGLGNTWITAFITPTKPQHAPQEAL